MHLEITRHKKLSGPTGTFGALVIDGAVIAQTCEQPWNGNAPGASCIPPGDYELRPYDSGAHGATVVFHNPALNVYATLDLIPRGRPGRSLCEIHSANWPFQLRGCVAVGARIEDMPPHGRGITDSVATLGKLMALWGDRHGLTATIRGDG
jgi:Family of unknown function (DUF5675)